MSKTTIETYRGIEIWFDTDIESFQCDIDNEKSIKKSYTAVKKFIDEWKKDNSNFKPFSIERNPNSYHGTDGTFRVVGIRKDGRFIFEDKNGNKKQLAEYYETDYILPDSENKYLRLELEKIKAERDKLNKLENEIKSKFKITTLKDVKQNYL